MSENYPRCVIDSAGIYQTCVLTCLEQDGNGNAVEVIHRSNGKPDYILKKGERLVHASPPHYPQFVKPVWSDSDECFVETATPEEIKAAAYQQLQKNINQMDPDSVTLEEVLDYVRAQKLAEIGSACERTIYAGTAAQTSEGEEHFSLTGEDQINIQNLVMQMQDEKAQALYHADGKLCRPFSVEEVMSLATTVTTFKTMQLTYCNHLNTWIRREGDLDTLQGIYYGAELPADLADNIQMLMAAGGEVPV